MTRPTTPAIAAPMCKKHIFVAICAHTWFIVLYVFQTITEWSYVKLLCFYVTTSKHKESRHTYHSYCMYPREARGFWLVCIYFQDIRIHI